MTKAVSVGFYSATIAMIAVTGAVVMLSLTWHGFASSSDETMAMVLSAFIGAICSGAFTAWLFGHDDVAGWVIAALGAVLATGIGAALGGCLFFSVGYWFIGLSDSITLKGIPQVALLSGMVVLSSLVSLGIGLPWLALMTLTHLLARHLRSPA